MVFQIQSNEWNERWKKKTDDFVSSSYTSIHASLVKYGRPTTIKNKTHETCSIDLFFIFFYFSLAHFIFELRARFDNKCVKCIHIHILDDGDGGRRTTTMYIYFKQWKFSYALRPAILNEFSSSSGYRKRQTNACTVTGADDDWGKRKRERGRDRQTDRSNR